MLSLLVLAAAASATPDDKETKACFDHAELQVELNGCAAAAFKRADDALNVQWPKTYAIYKRNDAWMKGAGDGDFAVGGDDLLKGQRAWLTYRESTCRAVGSLTGRGTISPMNFSLCMASITWKRVAELVDLTINPNSGEQM